MTETMRKTSDGGNYGRGIFIDLKKAFDTVNHGILLKKQEHYGVKGTPLLWFESYLSNRKQCVSINGNTSDELIITHGVPQGSVLGPLLFRMFINDLPNVSKHLTFYLFADDINIYFESSDLPQICKVRKWLETNRLALNIDKTNFVIFRSQRQRLTEQIVLKIGRKKVKEESHVKVLGIMLDSNLSWKFHLADLSKKLARTAGLFYKIRHYAPTDKLNLLYHGIFAPFLSYGLSVWGLTYPSLYEPITVLQKKILKILSFSEINAPSGPLFDRLQILKLNDMFQLQVASFVYECTNNIVPVYFRNYFTLFIGSVLANL